MAINYMMVGKLETQVFFNWSRIIALYRILHGEVFKVAYNKSNKKTSNILTIANKDNLQTCFTAVL